MSGDSWALDQHIARRHKEDRAEQLRLAADLARVTAERDALLVVRDAMQSQLDAWFVAHPHPPEASS